MFIQGTTIKHVITLSQRSSGYFVLPGLSKMKTFFMSLSSSLVNLVPFLTFYNSVTNQPSLTTVYPDYICVPWESFSIDFTGSLCHITVALRSKIKCRKDMLSCLDVCITYFFLRLCYWKAKSRVMEWMKKHVFSYLSYALVWLYSDKTTTSRCPGVMVINNSDLKGLKLLFLWL